MLPFGAAEKAAKKAVPFAADAAGLDAAKKGALASLPDSLVDKLGQGSPDMFFSAALTQTAAKAACASGKAEAACLLFSDKAEFNIDRAPALLVVEQGLKMLGALAGGTEGAGPPQRRSSRREACSGGLCAVALLDGGPDNGNKEAQLAGVVLGAFDAETLGAFGNGVAAGRRATESIDAVPALQEVDCAGDCING
ncbi:hypothetical protein EMIHUDRAFT_245743 [Emiliania huxleyi CCMP1516]|uniref:Uncharacterized protein n=2 Tax=Emiliania huxleyi TaxID=2903 RepID=A0A0D3IWB3_EMIH1|nr:hypothetical protein EMIHUDRAFT_245743 [Emiliania huxleyi CCMP1516]EOD15548.1 hypothetical protein EMIHUDRAFT_245743 [Emiliania huxleyi CCMP1516]|eukprot:XP_005767977.1 hypothetical protein EMIHUDRAFT_245743 [Emiliania huxleyi CCMP1516]